MVDSKLMKQITDTLRPMFKGANAHAAVKALTGENGLVDYGLLENEDNRNLYIFHLKDELLKHKDRVEKFLALLNASVASTGV